MTTSHQQIANAIVEALKSAGVAQGRVYRARTRAIGTETPHGVVVRLSRSASTLASVIGGRTSWRTLIDVECYGRQAGGLPDTAADQVAKDVFDCLAANPTLDGLAMDVEPLEGDTLAWDYDEQDTNMTCIIGKFLISHQTTGRTLTL